MGLELTGGAVLAEVLRGLHDAAQRPRLRLRLLELRIGCQLDHSSPAVPTIWASDSID